MNERWFLDNFLTIARDLYPESVFLDGLTLPCAMPGDYDGPVRLSGDLVEIDFAGRPHLWLFASVFSPEVVAGAAIGRLFAYDRVFRATDRRDLAARIEAAARRRRYDADHPAFGRVLARMRPEFESWNLVVCGGRGCELAGRDDNPMYRLYAPLSEMIEAIRDVNTWHFYQTSTGFDLRSLWDLAAFGRLSLSERLAIWSGRDFPLPAPGDDFDIRVKRDLHMKRRKGPHAEGWRAWMSESRQLLAG